MHELVNFDGYQLKLTWKYLCLSDRFDKSEGIVVIGATNFPEVLDK